MNTEFKIRNEVSPDDPERVREIVDSTGFFYDYEIEVAVELVQENLAKGSESGYNFLFVEMEGKTVGYSCFGLIPCTESSFDLYWIVVHNQYRNLGIGRKLLTLTEQAAARMGSRAMYAETSSQPQYEPTRRFYLSNHYTEEARLKDFYKEGDDKLIYSRIIRS